MYCSNAFFATNSYSLFSAFRSVFDLQDKLRGRGWIVPAYTCPTGATSLAIMRVVVKQNFSCDMAEMLLNDFLHALDYFDSHPAPKDQAPLGDKLGERPSK